MEFLKALKYFGLALVFVLSAVFFSKLIDKNTGVSDIGDSTSKIAQCPSDTNSYLETRETKKLILIEDKPSFAEKNSFEGHDYNISIKRTGLNSKISCGYLFYRVSNGDAPIDQEYMNLYMGAVDNHGGIQFGGQLLPTNKTAININEADNKTEILLRLDSIPYDGKDRINIKQADWVSLLNVTDKITFNIALNTVSSKGKIDLVEFVYKCVNPETGEETNDCNLELIK